MSSSIMTSFCSSIVKRVLDAFQLQSNLFITGLCYNTFYGNNFCPNLISYSVSCFHQRILKGEVSLYCCPPVWVVWNQLYDNWQFLFLVGKQTNPNQSNRRSMVQWYFHFSIPCFHPSLLFAGKAGAFQSGAPYRIVGGSQPYPQISDYDGSDWQWKTL